jgi:hypothetical protein
MLLVALAAQTAAIWFNRTRSPNLAHYVAPLLSQKRKILSGT